MDKLLYYLPMKFLKRLLIFLLVLVIFVVAAALLAPIIFKDQIVSNVKQGINEQINAEVDFKDINISFLSSFPAINLTIDDYSVVGIDTFAGYPLAQGKQASLDLDFWSVINGSKTGEYIIESIKLVDPDIRILVLNEQLANYNITKSDGTTEVAKSETSTSGMRLNLASYEIENGHLIYDDRLMGANVEASGFNHKGTGDFSLNQFDLNTASSFESLYVKHGNITYLNKAKVALDAIFGIDLENSKYTFKENKLLINALALNFDGFVAMPGEDIDFDLTFNAPGTNFAEIWSLIPSAYSKDYSDIKAGGTFALNGSVKGPFNGNIPRYPAFKIDVDVKNGSVQYPGSPVAVNGINTQVNVNSPSSDLNRMVIDLPNFAMNLGGDPFQGKFKLSSPIKDPTVDADIKGKIDLNKWNQLMPLDGVKELSGLIDADVSMKQVSQSTIEAADYGAVIMEGGVKIDNLVYATDELPKVSIDHAQADFTPQSINLPQFAMQLGKSDLSGSASIDNLLAYFSPEKTMTGTLNISSNYFDADEWAAGTTSNDSPTTTPAEMRIAEQENLATSSANTFNRFDFNVNADVKKIKYDTYQLENNRLNGHFQANKMVFNELATTIGETSLNGSGTVNNAWDYIFQDAILGGKLKLSSPYINLDDFMQESAVATSSSSGSSSSESVAVIPVPQNINMLVDMNAGKVKYTDMTLEDVAGDLIVKDGQVVIQDGKMKLLGGAMDFSGAYDTSEPGEPGFRFHYDMQSLRFNKAFQFLNTFKQLAPIAEYINGQFNSDLVVTGKLGNDLYPLLNTINAEGFLQTKDASLASIQPLQKLGNALNVQELKERINLAGIKSWFKIENGTVAVEPFKIRIAGIPMQISGRHGLDMNMDYSIQAAVPREMIDGNIVTGSAISALDRLAGEASKLGLDISPGDTLNFGIGLTGTFASPNTSVKLLGTSGGSGNSGSVVDNVVDQTVDQVRDNVNQQVDELKETAAERLAREEARAREIRDSIRLIVRAQRQRMLDSIANATQAEKERLLNEATNAAQNAVNQGANAIGSELEGKTKEEIDKIRNRIENFNPFKKKKKKKKKDGEN